LGIAEILTLVFVVLKLTEKIDWSWWLVLLPEIIALVFYFIIIVGSVIFGVKQYKQGRKK
jgi:hypothetical protein